MRFSASLAILLAFGASSIPAAEEHWLIPADKIYTAPDAVPVANGNVLVKGGRISAVADERSRIAIPEGTRTSQCRGVVVAGFQNSHVHFMGPDFEGATQKTAAELEGAVESMLTRYGFTTVFDTTSIEENTVAIRSRIEKGEIRGPRILTVGWGIFPADGIPIYLQDLPKTFLERLPQPRNADEARAVVRSNIAGGADGTKLFVVTPQAKRELKSMASEVALAATKETHARGKLVFAHPTSIPGLRAGLDAGVDVFVHTTLGEKEPWDEALVKRMVAQRVSVIPTFKLWQYELDKQKVPKDVTEKLVAATLDELRSFKKGGGQILFGTDVGYMTDYDPTDEYVWMSKAGLSAAEILASLTTAPAERLQESKRRGRVAPGLDADLVVLAADPADDVKNFANVRCVFRGGRLIYSAPARGAGQ
jgi:imidazolonepropionase-like amidohydrolase